MKTDTVSHKGTGVEQCLPAVVLPGSRGGGIESDSDGLPLTAAFLCTLLWSMKIAHIRLLLTPGRLHKSVSECSGTDL